MNTYRVDVDHSPMYELLASIRAFSTDAKALDVGADWRVRVREIVSAEVLEGLDSPDFHAAIELLDLLVWRARGVDEPGEFIEWMAAVPAGELFDLLLPHLADAQLGSLRAVAASRGRYADLLRQWNESYFRTVDRRILDGLRSDADRVREIADGADAVIVVEEVTNGIFLTPEAMPPMILVRPQYHCRPLNILGVYRGTGIIQYAADVLPPVPGEPPPYLMRLTRALADESRLRILHLLSDGPLGYAEVAGRVGLARSTAHHHLVALRIAGLVRAHLLPGSASAFSLRPSALQGVGKALETYVSCRKE